MVLVFQHLYISSVFYFLNFKLFLEKGKGLEIGSQATQMGQIEVKMKIVISCQAKEKKQNTEKVQEKCG